MMRQFRDYDYAPAQRSFSRRFGMDQFSFLSKSSGFKAQIPVFRPHPGKTILQQPPLPVPPPPKKGPRSAISKVTGDSPYSGGWLGY